MFIVFTRDEQRFTHEIPFYFILQFLNKTRTSPYTLQSLVESHVWTKQRNVYRIRSVKNSAFILVKYVFTAREGATWHHNLLTPKLRLQFPVALFGHMSQNRGPLRAHWYMLSPAQGAFVRVIEKRFHRLRLLDRGVLLINLRLVPQLRYL